MIFDCHSHIASYKYIPYKFFEGWLSTIKRTLQYTLTESQEQRINEIFFSHNHDEDCSKLILEMKEAGIDKAILLIIDFGLAFPDLELDIEQIHLEHKKILDQNDQFVVFSGIDPRRGQYGLDLFEKAVTQWGFKGLKLYPPCGFSPSDKIVFPYYEICKSKNLPVLIHTGPTTSSLSFKYAHPMEVDEAARSFPDVNFILAHAGIMYYQEASILAQYRPNIYLDISSFQNELKDNRLEEIIKWSISRGLSRRLLFGTDWPIHRFSGNQKKWVNKIEELKEKGILTSADLENMFSGNMNRILGEG